MSSTASVNFSVRQNKAIERQLAFDSLRRLMTLNGGLDYLYVGLGSVWFVDFDMAHRDLAIDTMISIEADDVVFRRAEFNKPYRTVEVVHGLSHLAIPNLMSTRPELLQRPWIVWLDYDTAMDEIRLEELELLVLNLPPDSVLLTTFNAKATSYGTGLTDRKAALVELFGDAFPDEDFPTNADLKDPDLVMSALATAVIAKLRSRAIQVARPGGFLTGFNLRYQDGAPMVTVGGLLPSPERAVATSELVSSEAWSGICPASISTPPLTIKEAQALKALMPQNPSPTRVDVQALGFDLEDEQIASFVAHYKSFPTFVQAIR